MDKIIKQENFIKNLFAIFGETFDNPRGIYLDKGASLIQTLGNVSDRESSIPVGNKCASLAAQVAHITFYPEVLEKYFVKQEVDKVDRDEIWRTIHKATPEEWEHTKPKLKNANQHIETMFKKMKYGMTMLSADQWPLLCILPITSAGSARRFAR
jgi:hypothetical protein